MTHPAPLATTPPQYTTGWIKQDPVSLQCAIRTSITTDPTGGHDWLVGSLTQGSYFSVYATVQTWTDM